jgi:hypothetical protein
MYLSYSAMLTLVEGEGNMDYALLYKKILVFGTCYLPHVLYGIHDSFVDINGVVH